MRQRALAAVGAALLLLLVTPELALAHARLVRANPPPDALLRTSPAQLHLWFSEDLNGTASRVIVWDRYRHPMTSGPATLVGSREMQVPLKPLHPGSYLVLWTSVSAQDGHVLRGSYLFSVKVRGPGPSLAGVSTGSQQGFPDAVGLLALISRWVELLAAVTWGGAAIFSALVMNRPSGTPGAGELATDRMGDGFWRTRRLIRLALVLLFIGSTGVLLTDAYGIAGNDWGSVLTHSTISALFVDQYGQLWVARQVVLLIALAFTFRGGPITARRRSEAAMEQTIYSVFYLYALAASGHAASANIGVLPGHHGSIFSIAIGADWLHLLADATWLGGQIYIVLVLIPVLLVRRHALHGPAFLAALNRFSPLAYASIAAYAVSGLFSAKVQIPSWYAYFYSAYGRALIVKMLLIGLMMAVSAYTVYLLRPRIARAMFEDRDERQDERLIHRLAGWLQVNPVLGVGVLLATSVMFYYPVPVGFGPPGPSVYTAHGGGMSVGLRIQPGRSGPNTISVALRDSAGQPVRQAHVSVLTTMLEMPMGSGVASLSEKSPGEFAGSTDLGMGGRWRLQVLIYRPSGLTRVPIEVRVAA